MFAICLNLEAAGFENGGVECYLSTATVKRSPANTFQWPFNCTQRYTCIIHNHILLSCEEVHMISSRFRILELLFY